MDDKAEVTCNDLRQQFQNFSYTEIPSSFHLISHIASNPPVAWSIQTANFSQDSQGDTPLTPPNTNRQAIKDLFAQSSYLQEAGLDWETYYTTITQDHAAGRYSQHAAVFVLTLLPNLQHLQLPKQWEPDPDPIPSTLLDVILRRARTPDGNPSLARVQTVQADVIPQPEVEIEDVFPFLALPELRRFRYPHCIGQELLPGHEGIMPFTSTVEELFLGAIALNRAPMANLLRNTPRLKKLVYWYSLYAAGEANVTDSAFEFDDWDLNGLVMAIRDEVGNTLDTLCINIEDSDEIYLCDPPCAVSMSGFPRLERLEVSVEIASYNLITAAPKGSSWSITDLVPVSVSQLSLLSRGTGRDADTLQTLFCDFAASTRTQLPNLKEVYLTGPPGCHTKSYAVLFDRLAGEVESAGVAFRQGLNTALSV